MSEPLILPVKPGSISKADKAKLSKAGVIVVEHDNPSELRLLRGHSELDSNDLLSCAMKALTADEYGTMQRDTFTRLVAAAIGTPKAKS